MYIFIHMYIYIYIYIYIYVKGGGNLGGAVGVGGPQHALLHRVEGARDAEGRARCQELPALQREQEPVPLCQVGSVRFGVWVWGLYKLRYGCTLAPPY